VVVELHELLHVRADGDLFEADEHADAVIHVHDQVAYLQVAEVGEERAAHGATPLVNLPLLLENVRLRIQLEQAVGQTEAAREIAGGDEHRCGVRVFCAVDWQREDLVFLQQLECPLRSP
jgi:hypothetical protein